MKIERCSFEYDKWGLYILPMLGYSNTPKDRSIWFGWLRWLWRIYLTPNEKSEGAEGGIAAEGSLSTDWLEGKSDG